jgi:hemoglobin-like flavoprotein
MPSTEAPLTCFFALPGPQALLLAATWNACEDRHHDVADAFYTRLFERLPTAKAVFSDPAGAYRARLVAAIGMTLAHIDRPQHVHATLAEHGQQLAQIGFDAAHYPAAAAAMRGALADVLGEGYSAELDAACDVLAHEAARAMA